MPQPTTLQGFFDALELHAIELAVPWVSLGLEKMCGTNGFVCWFQHQSLTYPIFFQLSAASGTKDSLIREPSYG